VDENPVTNNLRQLKSRNIGSKKKSKKETKKKEEREKERDLRRKIEKKRNGLKRIL